MTTTAICDRCGDARSELRLLTVEVEKRSDDEFFAGDVWIVCDSCAAKVRDFMVPSLAERQQPPAPAQGGTAGGAKEAT